MNEETHMTEETFVSMVSNIVQQHGCHVVDIDFESKILNLDGPEAAVAECARSLAEMMD